MAKAKSLGSELGMPVVLEEPFILPNGSPGYIRVYKGKAAYGAVLRVGARNGRNWLPVSTDHKATTARECMDSAKRFLMKPIYGNRN